MVNSTRECSVRNFTRNWFRLPVFFGSSKRSPLRWPASPFRRGSMVRSCISHLSAAEARPPHITHGIRAAKPIVRSAARCFKGELALAEIIVVTSGKGGVGKTTTSASIACGLARRGKRVAVVDFDIGLRNLDLIMGCERRVVYDFVNVIPGDCGLKQALIKDKSLDTLYVGTAMPGQRRPSPARAHAASSAGWWPRGWSTCSATHPPVSKKVRILQ